MPAGNFNYDFASVYSYGSPGTNSYNFAWDVRSSGAMDYGHYGSRSDYSYGVNSPGTNYSKGAWSILSSGNSENTSSGYNIDLSYGLFYHHSYNLYKLRERSNKI